MNAADVLPSQTVLDELRDGDTAHSLAARLNEAPGHEGRTTCRRLLPVLNRLREQGILTRRTFACKDGGEPVAHWGFSGDVAIVGETGRSLSELPAGVR